MHGQRKEVKYNTHVHAHTQKKQNKIKEKNHHQQIQKQMKKWRA